MKELKIAISDDLIAVWNMLPGKTNADRLRSALTVQNQVAIDEQNLAKPLHIEEHANAIKAILGKALTKQSILALFDFDGMEAIDYEAIADKQHSRQIELLSTISLQLPVSSNAKSFSNEAIAKEIKQQKPTPNGLKEFLDARRAEGYNAPWHESFDAFMQERLIKFFTTSTQQYFKQGKSENAKADFEHWRVLGSIDVADLGEHVLSYLETTNADTNGFNHRLKQWIEYAEKLERFAENAEKQRAMEEQEKLLAEQAKAHVAKQAEQAKQAKQEAELAEPAPLLIQPQDEALIANLQAEAEAKEAERLARKERLRAIEMEDYGCDLGTLAVQNQAQSQLAIVPDDIHLSWTMRQAKEEAQLEELKAMSHDEFLNRLTPEAKEKYFDNVKTCEKVAEAKAMQQELAAIFSMTEADEIEWEYNDIIDGLMQQGKSKEEAMMLFPKESYA